jgi:methylenetetrahydrofolate dehydrogenase (NADP+)/methenyltetrahydrofolate cyclohydrolase
MLLYYVNKISEIDCVLLQLPLPISLPFRNLSNVINHLKDIDRMTSKTHFEACTPLACAYLIHKDKKCTKGRKTVFMGKSTNVIKPLIKIFTREKSIVSHIHNYSKNSAYRLAFIEHLFIAIGHPEVINDKYLLNVKNIVDIGINYYHSKSICGDLRCKFMRTNIESITPVPKGIGVLTVSLLFYNVLMI